MKNAFVVLVCFCARLNAFIVPRRGDSEFLEEGVELLSENLLSSEEDGNVSIAKNTELLELLFSTDYPKIMDLEVKQENMNDKALYEHITKKENNINERSFIVIDQRFKVPLLSQLYSRQLSAQKNYGGTKHFKTFGEKVDSDSKFFDNFQSPFNTYKATPPQVFVDPIVRESHVKYYDPPKRINYNTEKKDAIVKELNNLKVKVQAATRAIGHQYTRKKSNIEEMLKNIDRLEYLELLKQPILRSEVKSLDEYMKDANTEDNDYDNKHFKYNSKIISPAHPTLKIINYDPLNSLNSYQPPRDFNQLNTIWSMKKMRLNDAVRSDDVGQRVSVAEDREPFKKHDKETMSEKIVDEKRNVNTMTTISDSEQTNNQCIAPDCTANTVTPHIKSHDSKCKCDSKAEEIIKSDLGDDGEALVRNSDKD